MIDFGYLYQGVCGLANAHRAGALSGHLGAAVAAGYFLGEDLGDWRDEVFQGISGELDRILRGEEKVWFNAKQAGVTPQELFQPLPKEEPDENLTKSIAEALEKNVDRTRQSGHNVIFASLALRALHGHRDYATPTIVQGIVRLIGGFDNAHAGRGYYGRERGWLNGGQVELPPADDFPPHKDLSDMASTTIAELIATAAVKKQGFGGMWHIVNHAAGIVELDRLGYKTLAEKSLPAHHEHIRLWRTLPDVESELGAVLRSEHDPREPEYWRGMLKRDEARLTHRIKTLYGFYTLLPLIDDESKRKEAEDAFLHLMA